MPNNFIIYCFPRTGSYHLMSLLDSCDDIICHGEVFKPNRIEIGPWHKKHVGFTSPSSRDEQPIRFIRRLRALNPHKHFGFKIFQTHVHRVPQLDRLITHPVWKTILLYREPIATYASWLRARETRVWTLRDGAAPVSRDTLNVPVTYTEESLREFSQSYNHFLDRCAAIRERKLNSFVIYYDQINDETALDALVSFLGSAHSAPLSSDYRRQFRGSLIDGFANWNELQERLSGDWPFLRGPAPSVPIAPDTAQAGSSPQGTNRYR